MKKYDKIEIFWYDAVRTDTWGDSPSTSEKEMKCYTLGYFYSEDEYSLTVVSTYGREDSLHSIQIPKGCIFKIKNINGNTKEM